MPQLSIVSELKDRLVGFAPEKSLRDILDTTNNRVRTGCRGSGACGLCRIQILDGTVHGPTPNEVLLLSDQELREGVRLACQVTAQENLRIKVLNPAPPSNWRKMSPYAGPEETARPRPGQEVQDPGPVSYGVAVDLGTTTISLSLWEVPSGKRLSGIFGLNQQARFGADVMTRLSAACRSEESAREISRAVKDCLFEGLMEMCAQEGYDPRKISQVAIVGNTAMLSLLTEKETQLLLQPQYWTKSIDCRPRETKHWFEAGNIAEGATVSLYQPLAGFIGSDLLAGVLSTRLTEIAAGSLLIDFGTNSEIALWDGTRLWVTSAAGGPAFEGCGISCGLPAGPGAIYKIDPDGESGITFKVLGDPDGEAQGLCGSGLIDLVAYLVRSGKVDRKGRLTDRLAKEKFVLPGGNPALFLNARDVDLFQRAKAAIGVGVRYLLKASGLKAESLQRICIGGCFGSYLNIRNAQEIGLLPPAPLEGLELCGNTALAGCELLLLSPAGKARLESLREKAEMINLAQVPEFEDLFLESLFLQPLPRK